MNLSEQKTKVAIAILGYRDDSELLLQAQRCAAQTFADSPWAEPRFVLIEDAWCPVNKECREKFLSISGSSRIVTGYRRGTMLLGGENFLGQCEAFQKAAEKEDADILVKLDADTLLLKDDWLEQFVNDPKALCAGAFDFGYANHTSVFGFCYALKRSVLPLLVEDARRFPAHHKAWEDHETSSRVFRIANGDMDSLLRWRANTPGDDFWCVALKMAHERLANARVASCGWDYSTQPAEQKPAFRARICSFMKHINDLRGKIPSTNQKGNCNAE